MIVSAIPFELYSAVAVDVCVASKAPFFLAGEDGPAISRNEERRHVYLKNRLPVRIKIKRRSGRYSNWYRVTKGNTCGWQAGKPDGFIPCPYTGEFDAFDTEFLTEPLYWPEGENSLHNFSNRTSLANERHWILAIEHARPGMR